MTKLVFCISKNKDADQLRSNREDDQRLCFRYIDSKIPLLPKYEISSLWPSSVVVQPGLCGTWSETPKTCFYHNEAHFMFVFTNFHNGCKKRIPIQALTSLSKPCLFKVRDAHP